DGPRIYRRQPAPGRPRPGDRPADLPAAPPGCGSESQAVRRRRRRCHRVGGPPHHEETPMPDYAPPLAQFLTLGDPDRRRSPPDYLRMGFGPEHIPELIRMATDRELNWADNDSPWVWAPVHAWRALGQLRAAEAVGPLLQVLEEEEEEGGDYALDDLPTV